MTRDEIFTQSSRRAGRRLGVDEEEVTPDAVIRDDLGAESIDFLDIMFRLEKAFGIKIPKGEMMPEDLAERSELVQDGKVTPEGMAMLKEKMPHVDFARVREGPELDNMSKLFTVDSIVNYVEQKLKVASSKVKPTPAARRLPAPHALDLDRQVHRVHVRGRRATAVKNVSLAEEHLHDLYPAFPIVPHSLIVEGMAQTAGILVGEARNFAEKVILAKIGKATFHRLVRPGRDDHLRREDRAAQRDRARRSRGKVTRRGRRDDSWPRSS